MVKYEVIASLRPGNPADMLRKAFEESWKEPDCHAEGYMALEDFSARITIDDKIGQISFYSSLPIKVTIGGIIMGGAATSFDAGYPHAISVADKREEYGYSSKRAQLQDGIEFIVGFKDDKISDMTLINPNAIYPERPYKYADLSLTDAFDLELAAPVRLDERPQNGWCFGLPPSIWAERWPFSYCYRTPLRHAFTLKLPEQYRTQGSDLVAISLFVDEMFDESLPYFKNKRMPVADVNRFDMFHWGAQFSLFWLSEEEFNGPLSRPAFLDSNVPKLGWLQKSPLDYFDREALPSTALNEIQQLEFKPDDLGRQKLGGAKRLETSWATLPAREALEFCLPINIIRREGDPNVGKPARELDNQNAFSGYVPVWSDKGQELNLMRFYYSNAHLGGTMRPNQIYPMFSPYYLEFRENFGGFNFGCGIAQLDLKQMLLEWT